MNSQIVLTTEPRFIRVVGLCCAILMFCIFSLVALGNTVAFVTGGVSSAVNQLKRAGADPWILTLVTFFVAVGGLWFTNRCWKDLKSLIARKQKVAESGLVMLFCALFGLFTLVWVLFAFTWLGLAVALFILPLMVWTLWFNTAKRRNPIQS